MKVQYCNNDGGEPIFTEERDDISQLLAVFKEGNDINLRWPGKDRYFHGKYYNSILDIEIDGNGNTIETLMVYFDEINSK